MGLARAGLDSPKTGVRPLKFQTLHSGSSSALQIEKNDRPPIGI